MAASIDPSYVLAPSLQMYFVDKDSGLALDNGQVFFYEDQARSVPKTVYQIVSAAPGGPYTYDPLPNPVTLSGVGTFQDDNGNDILPYYYPFDDDGNIELYYIEVYDKDGALQFTREAWPNFSEDNIATDQDVTNFVPNGQFLAHNNIPAVEDNDYHAGEVYQDVTILAPGGWTFERTTLSTATDIVTFPRYDSAVTQPTGNPRYAVQIQTTVAGSDTYKDLRLTFPDVNKFASNTQPYNFYFEGQSTTGSDIANVQLILRKYFGTGGTPSSATETVIGSLTLFAQQIRSFNFEILFGTNENKTIGTNDDDYVQLILRLPPTGVQTALFTDFALTVNDEVLTQFPEQTNAQQLDESLAGWLPTPDPNGMDLYLPIRLGLTGLVYDDTEVGKIYAIITEDPGIGELNCDGSAYVRNHYSDDGIPYLRLWSKVWDDSINEPIFGTGGNFVTCYIPAGNTNIVRLCRNAFSIETNPVEGSTPTGFSFQSIYTAPVSPQALSSYMNGIGGATLFGWGNSVGTTSAVNAGTSGFTVSQLRNDTLVRALFQGSIIVPAAGAWWGFGDTSTDWYMWFTIDGVGADPAPVGRTTTNVLRLLSSYTANDCAQIISQATSAHQMWNITTVAGSSIVPGSYFTFYSNAIPYYVYCLKDGVGADPAPSGQTLVGTINALTADTAAQVATKLKIAINSYQYSVPELNGLFLRGWNGLSTFDPDVIKRWSFLTNRNGNKIGTYQFDDIVQHEHGIGGSFNAGAGATAVVSVGGSGSQSGSIGSAEDRPINFAVNYVIKY